MATSFYGAAVATTEIKDYAAQAEASANDAEAFAHQAEAEADRAATEAALAEQCKIDACACAAAAAASEAAAEGYANSAIGAQILAETAQANAEAAALQTADDLANSQIAVSDANKAATASEASAIAAKASEDAAEGYMWLCAYYYDLILHLHEEVEAWHDAVETWYNQIEIWHDQVEIWHTEVMDAYAELMGWYLGAYLVPPTTDNNGDPIATGALYYDLNAQVMMVWDGVQWVPQIQLSTGTYFSYYYKVATATTVVTGPDFYGNTLAYQLGYVSCFLNGVKLIENEDFTASDGSSVVFVSPLVAGAEVEVIVTNALTLPANSNIALDDLQPFFDGVTTTFNLTSAAVPVTPGQANLLLISLRGVWQQGNVDYTVSGTTITFADPPMAEDRFFGLVGVPVAQAQVSAIYYDAMAPASPALGYAWFNGSILRIWNSVSWVQVDGGAW